MSALESVAVSDADLALVYDEAMHLLASDADPAVVGPAIAPFVIAEFFARLPQQAQLQLTNAFEYYRSRRGSVSFE